MLLDPDEGLGTTILSVDLDQADELWDSPRQPPGPTPGRQRGRETLNMSEIRPSDAAAWRSPPNGLRPPATSHGGGRSATGGDAGRARPVTSREERTLPRGRTGILILADAVALSIAIAITYVVAEMAAAPSIIAPLWLILALAVVALPVWVAIFTVYNLYERQNRTISLATFDELGELFHALMAGSLLFLILSQVLRRIMDAEVFFPVEAAMFLAIALPLVLLFRGSVRSWLLPEIMAPRRTLIVGTGHVAQMVERKISSHPGVPARAGRVRRRRAPRGRLGAGGRSALRSPSAG